MHLSVALRRLKFLTVQVVNHDLRDELHVSGKEHVDLLVRFAKGALESLEYIFELLHSFTDSFIYVHIGGSLTDDLLRCQGLTAILGSQWFLASCLSI